MTGVIQRIDFPGALELILKLQPETERIVVIGGTAPLDRRYLGRTEEAARSLAGRVQFDYWTTRPVAEMRQAVASLPPRTVIFFTTVFRDATGKSFLPAPVASTLAVASNVPVYVVADSLIGGGAVGGLVAHLDALGRRLGELAQQVLGGAAPASLPIEVRKDGVPMFDWRVLKRFGISETRLPPHSIVRFRELTIWQNYRWHIIAVAVLCLAQSVLIAGLLIQRRRRRLAEDEAKNLAGRLITAHEDERRRLARDLHDDLTQRLARLAIDAGKIERSAPVSNHDEVGRSMREELVRLSEDVHALSYRLHPSLLDDLGLVEALNAECDGFSRRESIPVEFKPRDVPRDVRPDTALCLFRVVQESLRNVARHAGASAVEVSLRKVDGGLEIAVRDNGTGFDSTRDRGRHSLGLASMKERVQLLGGELDIDSVPGSGTTVVAWVRLNGEENVMKAPRILLADDHRMVAEGLKSLLAAEFELVGTVEDGRALVEAAKKLRPDVIVADITMPHLNGIDALAQLKKDNPNIRVVFLTMHQDAVYARRALEAGASGYVLKHSAPAELVMAIGAALEGKTFITPSLTDEVLQAMKHDPKKTKDPVALLTPRQREILQLLAEGRSAKEIAAALGISPRTVEFHKYQMMESLQIQTSAELTHFAIKHGIVAI